MCLKLSICDFIGRGVERMARFAAGRAPLAETVSGFRAGEITAPINRGGYYRG